MGYLGLNQTAGAGFAHPGEAGHPGGFLSPTDESGAATERRGRQVLNRLGGSMNDQALRPLADHTSVCTALVDLLIDKGVVSEREFFERFERARAAGRRAVAPNRLDGQNVLLVEPQAGLAQELQTTLEDAGAEVLVARNAGEALARLTEFEFTAAVLDWRPETREHRTAARWLQEDGIPVLFHAADPSEDAIAECGGPMLVRPAPAEEMVRALARLTGSSGA
jgi:CheY-like chemotaxis protein